MDLPHDPAIPLLDIIPKGLKPENYSNIFIPMFIATQFAIAIMEPTQVAING